MLILSSVDPPENEHYVKHLEPNTKAYLGAINSSSSSNNVNNNQPQLLGEGTVYIAEDKFTWRLPNGHGFHLNYPQISLHAISRDLNNFHSQCLYLMFEQQTVQTGVGHQGHQLNSALVLLL